MPSRRSPDGRAGGPTRPARRSPMLRARVDPAERDALGAWLRPSELALFDAMHIADRRHGLDVVAHLRDGGMTEPEVLVAGLLHDCAKGDTGLGPRVAYSLGTRYGTWIWGVGALVPGWRVAIERLRVHADASAEMARAAGCSERTVELIRHQDAARRPGCRRAAPARRRGELMDAANGRRRRSRPRPGPGPRSSSGPAVVPRPRPRSGSRASTDRLPCCSPSSRRASSTS